MSEKEAEVAEKVDEATPKPEAKTPPVDVAKTFTQEDINDFLAEKEKTIVDLKSQVKGYSKLQSEADTENKRLRNLPQPTVNSQVMKEMVATLEAQQVPDIDGNIKPSPRLRALKATVSRMETTEKRQQAEQYWNTERQKLVKEAEELGWDVNSRGFDTVITAYSTGDLPEARRRMLRDAPKKEQPKKEGDKVEETEEEMKKRVRAEVVKELTKQDISTPSGVSASDKVIRDAYIANPNDPTTREKYMEMRKKQGK